MMYLTTATGELFCCLNIFKKYFIYYFFGVILFFQAETANWISRCSYTLPQVQPCPRSRCRWKSPISICLILSHCLDKTAAVYVRPLLNCIASSHKKRKNTPRMLCRSLGTRPLARTPRRRCCSPACCPSWRRRCPGSTTFCRDTTWRSSSSSYRWATYCKHSFVLGL